MEIKGIHRFKVRMTLDELLRIRALFAAIGSSTQLTEILLSSPYVAADSWTDDQCRKYFRGHRKILEELERAKAKLS